MTLDIHIFTLQLHLLQKNSFAPKGVHHLMKAIYWNTSSYHETLIVIYRVKWRENVTDVNSNNDINFHYAICQVYFS